MKYKGDGKYKVEFFGESSYGIVGEQKLKPWAGGLESKFDLVHHDDMSAFNEALRCAVGGGACWQRSRFVTEGHCESEGGQTGG